MQGTATGTATDPFHPTRTPPGFLPGGVLVAFTGRDGPGRWAGRTLGLQPIGCQPATVASRRFRVLMIISRSDSERPPQMP